MTDPLKKHPRRRRTRRGKKKKRLAALPIASPPVSLVTVRERLRAMSQLAHPVGASHAR